MASKKSKTKAVTAKKTTASPGALITEMIDDAIAKFRASLPSPIEDRKRLLAQVAGSIATGLVQSPSPSIASPPAMATAALDIAEQILTQAGIAPTEASADEASGAEAAS